MKIILCHGGDITEGTLVTEGTWSKIYRSYMRIFLMFTIHLVSRFIVEIIQDNTAFHLYAFTTDGSIKEGTGVSPKN